MISSTLAHQHLVDEHSPYPIITDVGALLRITHPVYPIRFYHWEETLTLFLTIGFPWEW